MSSGYLSVTDADRAEMLAAIGVSSIDELFEQIPPGVRFDRELDVPSALSELELVDHISGLAARLLSKHPELTVFQVKTVLRALAANVRRVT